MSPLTDLTKWLGAHVKVLIFDRIIVLRRGSICKEYKRGEPQETDILREAMGQAIAA